MSLIPYHPLEGREVVLRHRNAMVVRDTSSQRLEIRGSSECPMCHQPLRSPSPDRQFDHSAHHDDFVDPDYFRMLRTRNELLDADRPPPSPVRRLVEPVRSDHVDEAEGISAATAEFVSSTPAIQEGARIRKDAFSANYFRTFFVEERELGRGGKGVVLLVRHEIDGCQLGYFACKRVPVGDDHAWLEKVLVEVELLAKLSHPNLVSYRHVWLENVTLNRFGPSVACAFILQQYCNGGDLLHYVTGDLPKEATKEELKAQMRRKSKGHSERPRDLLSPPPRQLPLEEIFSLFKDITSGLAYLHGANYIHRDLKPSNCLLHREGKSLTCLISDFGEVQPENAVRKSTGSTGTISYCAPEVLKKDSIGRLGNFTTKSDIFSLGMILYFMCFGRLPYRAANTVHEELEDVDQLRAEITDWTGFQDERRERPDLPMKLYELLKRLLAANPTERPSAEEVLSVMRNESSSDGFARSARNVSPKRIRDLESPFKPGTPFHEPPRHAPATPSSLDDTAEEDGAEDLSPQPNADNTLQRRSDTESPRYRAPYITASRSQDGYRRQSPERADASSHRRESPTPTTPLLMAPPTTFLGEMWHRGVVVQHHTMLFLGRNAESSAFFLRLCMFLVKVVTLARPCWPFTANWGLGASLVAVAGLDLGIPGSRGLTLPRQPNHGVAIAGHELAAPFRWMWDWRISATLLVLHFLVLWLASRWDILCAANPDSWAGW